MIEPMLANLYDVERIEHRDAKYWWHAEEKLDGMRAIVHLHPDGRHRLFTRRISVVTGLIVEKSEHLLWLPELKVDVPVVLDGELHMGLHSRVWQVMEIMGCLPQEALDRQQHTELYFTAFDILQAGDQDVTNLGHRMRWQYLEAAVSLLGEQHSNIDIVETKPDNVSVDTWFREIMVKKGEGIMLKHPYAPYCPGKRPVNTWLKIKPVFNFVAHVTSDSGGEGRLQDMMGSLWYALYEPDGKRRIVGTVGTGFTDLQRQRKDWVGKVIEIAYTDLTENNIPQHPRFMRIRDDLTYVDCVVSQLRAR